MTDMDVMHDNTAVCPLCRGTVVATPATTFDAYHPGYHVPWKALPTKARETMLAACTGCEFAIDLHRGDGQPKTQAQLLTEVGTWLVQR